MKKAMRVIVPVLACTALLLGGCYKSAPGLDGYTHPDGDGRPDPQPDYYDMPYYDTPPDIIWDDIPMECMTITPTVLWADLDLSGCYGPEPFVTVVINEASPYCGEPITWSHSVEFIDDDVIQIIPSLYMCSDTWEWCDPGAVSTQYVTVYLRSPETAYTLFVGDQALDFLCLGGECYDTLCYLSSLYPTDYRPEPLFGTHESVDFEIWYSSGACGCTEFNEVYLTHPDYVDDNHWYGTLSGIICPSECCWECDCIDMGQSLQSLPGRDAPYACEVVLDGMSRDVRGLIVDPMADPMSECEVFPVEITAASTERAYYDPGEPVDVQVTLRYASYPSPTCCEVHTEVAYDVYGYDMGVYLFAYGGQCMACYDDSCPETETKTLRISANVLEPGEHMLYSRTTGDALARFYVYGED
jgi:hypothetical protein